MQIKTSAFKNEEEIPYKHTCDGDDVNPLIEIRDVPEGVKSLVLIIEDPDAPDGTWDHWLVWNIPSNTSYIHEDSLPESALIGKNGFGDNEYRGPCPPRGGGYHNYFFRAYALDKMLDLPEGASREELDNAMQNHIVDETFMVGKYRRT